MSRIIIAVLLCSLAFSVHTSFATPQNHLISVLSPAENINAVEQSFTRVTRSSDSIFEFLLQKGIELIRIIVPKLKEWFIYGLGTAKHFISKREASFEGTNFIDAVSDTVMTLGEELYNLSGLSKDQIAHFIRKRAADSSGGIVDNFKRLPEPLLKLMIELQKLISSSGGKKAGKPKKVLS